MYNQSLLTFKTVVDTGSFSKAAEKLFITHTAIIKQMNQLETHLGVSLFKRSSHGVLPTAAGRCLYEETQKIMKFSEEAISRIQNAQAASPKIIRIGNSPLYPCYPFMELWDKIRGPHPQYRLKVVPYMNDEQHLDDSFDILIGPMDHQLKSSYNPYFIPVGFYRFCLSMSREHRLAGRTSLHFCDLAGETLQIMKEGTSHANDAIRKTVKEEYPQIQIEDIPPYYNMKTFNLCADSGFILLSLECWNNVHPGLVSIPLDDIFTCSYGIIASPHPSEDVDEFLKIIQQISPVSDNVK